MEIKEGTRIISNLTGEVYRVKAVRCMAMVLEAEDGSNSVITEIGNIKLFYEMMENEKRSKNPMIYKKPPHLSIALP
jgi:hypothetical protein